MKRISCTALVVIMLTLWGCQSSDPNQASGEGTLISTVATTPPQIVPPPVLPQAVGGQLDLRTLAGTGAIVQMTYPTITNGDNVRVSWIGSSYYESPLQTVGVTRPVTFIIPYSIVAASKGEDVQVKAHYVFPGGNYLTSIPFKVTVVETSPPANSGEQVAYELNTRYANTSLTCTGNTPAYYCNGVIIRSTQSGSYDPWNPSPAADTLGGVSFSYMRRDAYVTSLYHASGFTFLPQEQANAQGKIAEYLCIYAYDAGTLVGPRGEKGCGLKPRSAPRADVSSCASVNVRTVAQWYAYTKTIQNRDYQCSLSTADATQFAASFQVRANRPPNMDALWNEMMVKTWAQNIPTSLPLESFFYVSTAGLAEAKTYQTKYRERTAGKWLPIIKLDLTKLNGNPFSYNSSDQAIQP